jgi:DNA sulfur modification protein DndD
LKDAQEESQANQLKIDDCLRQGNKNKLLVEKNKIKADIEKQEALSDSSLKALRKVFRDKSLAYSLVKSGISKAVNILGAMEKDKKLPKQSIPVLSELLDAEECFCGSSLKGEEGAVRVQHIKHIIKISEESDKLQGVATEVYYGMKSFSDTQSWLVEYNEKAELYFKAGNVLKDLQQSYESKEKEIDLINDDLLIKYRALGSKLNSEIADLIAEMARRQQNIVNAKSALSDINLELERASRKLNKDDSAVRKYRLAGVVNDVFSGVLSSIREVELKKVSDEMNRIFLQMIGSDPEANQHVIIKSAALTEDFDIVVLGPNGHRLDPDQDLNGASRRAITLAFILALTKVSGVEAPNVIDTPLGMMSGYVKQSVLLRTIEESSQPILFLTHSEINDVEEILDKRAGMIFTLTNPGHYPLQLVNPSGVSDSRVVKCSCNHRSHCSVCERRSTELLEVV